MARSWFLEALADFLSGGRPAPPAVSPPPPPPPPARPSPVPGGDAAQVVEQINARRRAAGLNPLAADRVLTGTAAGWSAAQAQADEIRHGDFRHRVVTATGDVGEDVAQTYGESPVPLWMGDKSHRDRILDPTYRSVGVGSAVSKSGKTYWTCDFAG